MDKLFTRACRDAGISLHSLRHIFASRLVMSGADLRTIQTLGGWHYLSLVQRYGHLSPGHCTRTIERIIVGAFHNDSQQTCFRGSRSSCRTAGKRVLCEGFMAHGEVREWPNRAVSKTAVLATGPWVRSPPSPPLFNRLCVRVRVIPVRCLVKCNRKCNHFLLNVGIQPVGCLLQVLFAGNVIPVEYRAGLMPA